MSKVISKRAFRNASKNIVAIPVEAVPYIGVGAMLAITAMDVKDACDTMRDMDNLLNALGVLGNTGETIKICGTKIPESEFLVSQVHIKIKEYEGIQEKLGGFLHEVKKSSEDKWSVFYESVGGTVYQIIHE